MHKKIELIEFALAHYAQTEVATACLALQDQHGASVTLLLCCTWLDSVGIGATADDLMELTKPVLEWERNTVWPLRQLRRRLKLELLSDATVETLRQQVKQAELAAEMLVLTRLGELPWPIDSGCSALDSYCRQFAVAKDCDDIRALRRAAMASSLNS